MQQHEKNTPFGAGAKKPKSDVTGESRNAGCKIGNIPTIRMEHNWGN